RWALARTPLVLFKGRPIPYKPNKNAIEGTLLHTLVEEYAAHLYQAHPEPFRPRRVLLGLLQTWMKKTENNPLINSKALASQIALEEILRAFAQASSRIQPPTHRPTGERNATTESPVQQDGAEIWLRDPESKLRGRA